MIQLCSIEKTFTSKKNVRNILNNFSLTIEIGQKIGLFGLNGSGKTTLLNILAGLEKPDTGEVHHCMKRISYVHQDYTNTLIPWYTCEKNILLPRMYHNLDLSQGRVLLNQLVQELNITFSLNQFPFALSGGQKQIISFMRALVLEPELLILDEPTAALDPSRRDDIFSVLQKHVTPQTTVIMSSHRGEEIKSFINRVIYVQNQPMEIIEDRVADPATRPEFELFVSTL